MDEVLPDRATSAAALSAIDAGNGANDEASAKHRGFLTLSVMNCLAGQLLARQLYPQLRT
jgi:hypothetical protein